MRFPGKVMSLSMAVKPTPATTHVNAPPPGRGILFKFANMEKLPNIHPGEILHEEFLIPLLITPYRLAKETNIPQTRISEIIKGNRRITADTALRLSQFFGNSAKFWLGLQDDFDIENELAEKHEELGHIKRFEAAL